MPRVRIEDWTTEDSLLTLKGWARRGLTDLEIAKNIGIKKTTFYDWCKKSANFSNSIKEGRRPVAIEVEDLFIKECKGYYTTEKTIEELPDGSTKKKIVERWNRPNGRLLELYLRTHLKETYGESTGDNSTLEKVDELLKGLNDAAIRQTK